MLCPVTVYGFAGPFGWALYESGAGLETRVLWLKMAVTFLVGPSNVNEKQSLTTVGTVWKGITNQAVWPTVW